MTANEIYAALLAFMAASIALAVGAAIVRQMLERIRRINRALDICAEIADLDAKLEFERRPPDGDDYDEVMHRVTDLYGVLLGKRKPE